MGQFILGSKDIFLNIYQSKKGEIHFEWWTKGINVQCTVEINNRDSVLLKNRSWISVVQHYNHSVIFYINNKYERMHDHTSNRMYIVDKGILNCVKHSLYQSIPQIENIVHYFIELNIYPEKWLLLKLFV